MESQDVDLTKITTLHMDEVWFIMHILTRPAIKEYFKTRRSNVEYPPHISMKDIVLTDLRVPVGRAVWYLEKYSSRDWYDVGVSLLTGWFTPKGIQALKDLLEHAVFNPDIKIIEDWTC